MAQHNRNLTITLIIMIMIIIIIIKEIDTVLGLEHKQTSTCIPNFSKHMMHNFTPHIFVICSYY